MSVCIEQRVAEAPQTSRLPGRHTREFSTWRTARPSVPTDLRDWFSGWTLACWAQQEVNHFVLTDSGAAPMLDDCSQPERVRMLSLLAFALASQVFGSEDIARACRSEPIFDRLCQGCPPFAHEILRFRRQNRLALEGILTRLFARAILCRFGLDSSRLPAELHEDLRVHAAQRLDLARHMDSGLES